MGRLPKLELTPGRPAKPPGLSKTAAAEWDRLLDVLDESGIQITKAHGRLLEIATTITADIEDAREVIKIEGAYIPNDKTGVMQMHPAARRLDALRRDYVKVLALLGIRTNVGTPRDDGESLGKMLGE